MTVLNDREIRKLIHHKNLRYVREESIQPASLDIHYQCPPWHTYILYPNKIALLSTEEYFDMPGDLCGFVVTNSSNMREGIMSPASGMSFIDPGFRGNLTIMVRNVGDEEAILAQNFRLGQVIFQKLVSTAGLLYGRPELGSKYQDSEGVVENREV